MALQKFDIIKMSETKFRFSHACAINFAYAKCRWKNFGIIIKQKQNFVRFTCVQKNLGTSNEDAKFWHSYVQKKRDVRKNSIIFWHYTKVNRENFCIQMFSNVLFEFKNFALSDLCAWMQSCTIFSITSVSAEEIRPNAREWPKTGFGTQKGIAKIFEIEKILCPKNSLVLFPSVSTKNFQPKRTWMNGNDSKKYNMWSWK